MPPPLGEYGMGREGERGIREREKRCVGHLGGAPQKRARTWKTCTMLNRLKQKASYIVATKRSVRLTYLPLATAALTTQLFFFLSRRNPPHADVSR